MSTLLISSSSSYRSSWLQLPGFIHLKPEIIMMWCVYVCVQMWMNAWCLTCAMASCAWTPQVPTPAGAAEPACNCLRMVTAVKVKKKNCHNGEHGTKVTGEQRHTGMHYTQNIITENLCSALSFILTWFMRSMQWNSCFDESREVRSVITSWEAEQEWLFRCGQTWPYLVIYTAVCFWMEVWM